MTGLAPETILAVVVVGLLAIAATSEVSRRTGVATPLLLVALGIGVGFIPGMPPIDIEPEWILAGVLPPLVYAAAVSMPPMNFRREFRSIASLSVTLVVLSSLALGGLFAWARLPDGVPASHLARAALDGGVVVAPGTRFFVDPADGEGHVRLNFASRTEDEIAEGIARLARAAQRVRGL